MEFESRRFVHEYIIERTHSRNSKAIRNVLYKNPKEMGNTHGYIDGVCWWSHRQRKRIYLPVFYFKNKMSLEFNVKWNSDRMRAWVHRNIFIRLSTATRWFLSSAHIKAQSVHQSAMNIWMWRVRETFTFEMNDAPCERGILICSPYNDFALDLVRSFIHTLRARPSDDVGRACVY